MTTSKYIRTYASQIKVNDIIHINKDYYDVSLAEDNKDGTTHVRGISFFRDSVLDNNYDNKFEFDIFQSQSKGVFLVG